LLLSPSSSLAATVHNDDRGDDENDNHDNKHDLNLETTPMTIANYDTYPLGDDAADDGGEVQSGWQNTTNAPRPAAACRRDY